MNITEETKKKLRKLRTISDKLKTVIYKGGKSAEVAMQFHADVRLYGVYEALLYVESYEDDGLYEKGTAQKAVDLFV